MTFQEWYDNQMALGNIRVSEKERYRGQIVGQWTTKYKQKIQTAKQKGIKVYLTLDEYLYKAYQAGLTDPKSISPRGYHLCRDFDDGDYLVNNTSFKTFLENIRERNEHFDTSAHSKRVARQRVLDGTHNFLKENLK